MPNYIEIVDDEERNELPIGNSKIIYRRFSSDQYRIFEKAHTKTKGRNRQGEPIQITDTAAVNDDLLDWIILDWEDVKHPLSKEDAPCTRENKLRLPASVRLRLIEVADDEKTTMAEKKTSSTISDS